MRQSKTIREFGVALVLLALFAGAATKRACSQSIASSVPTPQAAEPASAPPATGGPVLLIGGGDLLKISVFGAADSDQEVRIDQNGNASLNFIGSVHLGGLTASQAQTLIAKKL